MFNLGPGTQTGGGALVQSINHNAGATLPTATRTGYFLNGWQSTPTGMFTNQITGNVMFTAIWEPTGAGGGGGGNGGGTDPGDPGPDPGTPGAGQFQVTFIPNGGTRTGGGALVQNINSGAAAQLPTITPPSGQEFVSWQSNVAGMTPGNITGTVTFTAQWRPAGGGGGGGGGGTGTTGGRITGVNTGSNLDLGNNIFFHRRGSNTAMTGSWESNIDDTRPGDELRIHLHPDMFEWADGNQPQFVTRNHLASANPRITAGFNRTGFDAVRDVEIRNGANANANAILVVRFVDSFNSTRDRNYRATIFLREGNRRIGATDLSVDGYMRVNAMYVDSYDDLDQIDGRWTLDMRDSEYSVIAVGSRTFRRVDILLDYGVTVITPLPANRNVAISTNMNESNRDEEVYLRYNAVVSHVHIEQTGLNTASARVRIDIDEHPMAWSSRALSILPINMLTLSVHSGIMSTNAGRGFFLYDRERRFVGPADREVDFSSTFYITDRRINMSTTGGSVGIEDPPEVPNFPTLPAPPPGTGNNNMNPSTGRDE